MGLQHGSDGVRLMALKFVENTILLFTPDPNSSLPNQQGSDGELYNELLWAPETKLHDT